MPDCGIMRGDSVWRAVSIGELKTFRKVAKGGDGSIPIGNENDKNPDSNKQSSQ